MQILLKLSKANKNISFRSREREGDLEECLLDELRIETLVGGESGVETADGCVNRRGFLTEGKLLMGRRRDEGSGGVMELLNFLHDSFNFFFNFHGC